MQDDVSRLVGLEGFEVTRVIEVGGRLDLEVELVARAGCCPRCGRASVEVKDRPRVRVRDLPIAGRVTASGVAQAPLPLRGVRADVHRVAPASCRRASASRGASARRLFERVRRRRRARRGRARGAHDALPGRARLRRGRGDELAGAPRGAAGAAAVARRGAPPPRPRARDGRLRPRPPARGRGARRPSAAAGGALPALAARAAPAGDRGRLDRSLRGLPPGDPQRAAVGADRGRPLPPRARRQHRARLGPARAPARARAGAGRRGRAAPARAPAGARTSTAPATGCSRRASG